MWTNEVLSSVALQIFLFALPLAAVTQFGASAFEIGVLNSLDSVAALAFGLVAGVLIDRLGGARAVVVANIVKAIAALVLALALLVWHDIALLFLSALLIGIGGLVHDAGVSVAVVQLIGRSARNLNRLNSLLRGTAATAEVSGPGVAGLMIGLIGFGFASASTLVLFAAAALVVVLLSYRGRRAPADGMVEPPFAAATSGAEPGQDADPSSALSGIRFILRHPYLRPLVLSSFHFNFFSALVQAVFVIFCVRGLDFTTTDLAVLGIGGGAGGVLGGLLAASPLIERHAKSAYAASLLAPGACVLGMVAVFAVDSHLTQVAVVTATQAVWSAAMVVCIVLFNTIRQVQSPDALVGRIAASERLIAIAGELPGALLGGILGTVFFTIVPMLIGAAGMFGAALWITRLPSGRLFLPRHDDPAP